MSKQILSIEFEKLKQDLIKSYDNKGMRASGDWANGLEVFSDDNHAILFGLNYSEQLESGRNAGKQPPREMIEKWIVDKGIASRIEGEISISSLAYLIARKIGRDGWKREDYGGVDLISEVVTPLRIQSIIDKVGEVKVIEITTQITDLVKELDVA